LILPIESAPVALPVPTPDGVPVLMFPEPVPFAAPSVSPEPVALVSTFSPFFPQAAGHTFVSALEVSRLKKRMMGWRRG
jgi:hypothetical protein